MMRSAFIALLFSGALVLTGCEENVTAALGTDGAFSIYGVLNPKSDTQYVHVFPIEPTLRPLPAEPLDATMTVTDLTTGIEIVWRDSLVQDALGLNSHLFWAPMVVEHEHTYRVEVTGPSGSSRAVVAVPEEAELLVQDAASSRPVVLPILLNEDVPQLLQPRITYWVYFVVGFVPPGIPLLEFREYTFPYEGRYRKQQGGWIVDVNLTEGYRAVGSIIQEDETTEYVTSEGITLLFVTLDLIVGNAEWSPPDGTFDPNVLIFPEAMTNVENGFGFIGAGYDVTLKWQPYDHLVELSGFRPLI